MCYSFAAQFAVRGQIDASRSRSENNAAKVRNAAVEAILQQVGGMAGCACLVESRELLWLMLDALGESRQVAL